MGNGVISCCEASSSMQDEMTILSPRTLRSPKSRLILNEVSQLRYQCSPEYQETVKRINILKSMTLSSSVVLKVINSGPIAKDTRLVISYLGLEGSKRSACDGKVFFGSKRKEFGKVVNDIIIPVHKLTNKEQVRGRHFVICYSIEKDRFFLKNLNKGFGVYMRISFPIKVKGPMRVNIGTTLIDLAIVEGKKQKIEVSVEGKELRFFDPEDDDFSEISLGRGITCLLRFDDSLLSKVHALISYNQDHWILTDGDGEKPSTNGTWLYINEETQLFDSMIFKSNQCVFQVVSSIHNSDILK